MEVLVIIPARCGSVSLKNKNIKDLKGIPLFAHSIEYAKKSKYVSKIIVSTDSQLYLDIARKFGVNTPFLRPKKYAKNDSQDFEFVNHGLKKSEQSFKKIFDYVVILRPTSPLRPARLIEKSLKLLENNLEASSVRSVAITKEHPYRQWHFNSNNYIIGYEKSVTEPFNLPRQKLPEVFFQTGDIEVIRRDTIIKGSVSGKNVLPLIIDHNLMFDIDEQSDFDNVSKIINE